MILGHAELAAESAHDPVARQQIAIIRRVATDSAAIVKRIQDVARARSVRDHVVFDLAEVVREVWTSAARAGATRLTPPGSATREHPARPRHHRLRTAGGAARGAAQPGLQRPRRHAQGGPLSLAVARHGPEAVLTVADSGSGMPEHVRSASRPLLHHQGHARDRPRPGGGLRHRPAPRRPHRRDQPPRPGHHLHPELPPRRPAPEAARPADAPPSQRQLRVLVVDDEELVRGLMSAILGSAGHEVATAASGEEALRELAERDFDIVLTDLGMPSMNGWEVAAAARRIRPSAQIVLVTGWGETVVPEPDSGVARILSKPFSRAQLLACVDAVTAVPA